MKKDKNTYHHGNLAESLLNAVDEIASQFGLEAVTLRGCAKRVGVAPSSAFRHYADKRALMTAFATRALDRLSAALSTAQLPEQKGGTDAFLAVGLAYIQFALKNPAYFRAMWSEETIYSSDTHYIGAANQLIGHLKGGFAASIDDQDPTRFSAEELLAWSAVHGLANLFVDGPVGKNESEASKLKMAQDMIQAMVPAVASLSGPTTDGQ